MNGMSSVAAKNDFSKEHRSLRLEESGIPLDGRLRRQVL